ncbi:DUF4352 domain-containing protein [Actinomyces sp. 2119]|uniref:DUF4352 domain-containing protein n=1 Tax=Actinomyces lilanjuaniae TaxID=2321394 RepID=A0ABN5PQJ5_9ACTO|nr:MULTISPECIES: DUF4352 domain-containing protein [Actinomyces]AYD90653.1 DUF4352 domain-containing protein [Actinomyces lilanjuaniae]RJF43882.1 DUF4352 domain-containing protein [Actinomyces sp. 2119]
MTTTPGTPPQPTPPQPSAPYPGPGGQVPPVPVPDAPVPSGPKRSWFARHKVLTGLGALVLVSALASALGGGEGSSAGATTAPSAAADAAETDQAAAGSGDSADTAQAPAEGSQPEDSQPPSGLTFPGMADDDIVGRTGDTLTSKDVSITTTPVTAGDATLGPTACTTVTVVNGSTDPVDVNAFDFTLLNPEGAITDPGFSGTDTHLTSSTLVPQGSVSGDVCFDVDISAGGQYVVIYDPVLTLFTDRAAWVNEL